MLVVSALPPEDQVKAQAATELAVLGSAAVTSGLAGVVFAGVDGCSYWFQLW
jgi:hypothetical protein